MQVLYDPDKLTFRELIKKYLSNFAPRRRGADKFSQYRAAIFYHDDEQRRQALAVLRDMGYDSDSSQHLLEPAGTFYAAEEYHQDYYDKMSMGARGK